MASGWAPRPAAARARAMPSAVCTAVPEGASFLFGWWNSTTSAESKYGAAISASFMVSTAEMAKFGATRTPTDGLAVSQPRRVS